MATYPALFRADEYASDATKEKSEMIEGSGNLKHLDFAIQARLINASEVTVKKRHHEFPVPQSESTYAI